MKTISIFLALVNALLAGLLIASSLSPVEFRQMELWWLVAKNAAAAAVILIGVITWIGSVCALRARLISSCSLFLVALGVATAVWTVHLAILTGDMEFHMVVYGGSLAVQGIASLFGFVGDMRSVVI